MDKQEKYMLYGFLAIVVVVVAWVLFKRFSTPSYTMHVGMDSAGTDITRLKQYAGNIPMLTKLCNEWEECVGFNDEGFIKSKINYPLVGGYTLYTKNT